MKTTPRHTHIHTAFVLFTLATTTVLAQNDHLPAPGRTEKVTVQRKKPGFLSRAEKSTAPEQFAHAEALRLSGETKKAFKAYKHLVHTFHDAAEAPEAQRMVAKMLLEKGKLYEAFEEFQYIVKYYPGRLPFDEILGEQFKIANLIRAENESGLAIMGASTAKTLPLYQRIVDNAPNWERAPEAQFFLGVIHESRKEYGEAIDAYELAMLRYPKSAYVANAAFHRALCLYIIAEKSPRDEDRAQQAVSALVSYLRDYPSTPDADDAREKRDALKERLSDMYFTKATYYDRTARRPEAAIVAYNDYLNRFPTSERAADVQKRVTHLQQTLEEQKEQ